MLAVVAPGQGAQTPGFLAPWLELPAAAAALEQAQTVSGLDLIRLGTEGSADEIRDTAVAQPLLVAAALASAAALGLPAAASGSGALPDIILAGHSIGELPAAVLAGALSPDAAMLLARERGVAMAAACAAADTGMTAVLGGDPTEVDDVLAAAGLVAANRNGAGQVVAAGPRDGLDRLAENPPAKARLRPLAVAGAFHTGAMRPAQLALAGIAAEVVFADPSAPLLSNADGAVVTDGEDLRRRLVTQVAAPVLWDACMARMVELGVTALLELAPGGTLTGLAKRELRGVATVALRTPDDLAAARELLTASGAVGASQ
ncbi:MAG: [acyl-carrier-protein] S-malonyltransferase [Frankiaceae bacterium]|nr:[acyl-carrier-protein] S-malonyltransferase [Frankiaceae bacterium]